MTSALPPDAVHRPFGTLLVANRGEIACRIVHAAHGRGLRTVAVHNELDAGDPHVAHADLAVGLPGRDLAATYLSIDALLTAAAVGGADAVHPGYGFLSESAAFAGAVQAAGLVWVGPPPAAMESVGDKLAAKRRAAQLGIPVLPAVQLDGDDAFAWRVQARSVGYPLLLKAAAGGGGRGMRVVDGEADLEPAVGAARREAASAFGDGTVFAERLVSDARHVEVQVLADAHGAAVHLGERECSVQRRHQKVIEESPSPVVDAATRAALGDAAVRLLVDVGYVGLGTVEFLVEVGPDGLHAWLLEVNARVQVEHPVTEAVTGLDLVDLQLAVAAGEPLPLGQDDVALVGHAVEARLTAEDPGRGWLPTAGSISHFRAPDLDGVRWDHALADGVAVHAAFDPLLAKVIAHGRDRREAVGRLRRALLLTELHGPPTSREALVAVLDHPAFVAGDTTTRFLDDHPEVLTPRDPQRDLLHVLAATAAVRLDEHRASPLALAPAGWRSGGHGPGDRYEWELGGVAVEVRVAPGDATGVDRVEVRGLADGDPGPLRVGWRPAPGGGHLVEVTPGAGPSRSVVARVRRDATTVWVDSTLGSSELQLRPRFTTSSGEQRGGAHVAPVPGRITSVLVRSDDVVAPGDPLVALEAMKVEHVVRAAAGGAVSEVLVSVGDTVEAHQLLVRIEGAP